MLFIFPHIKGSNQFFEFNVITNKGFFLWLRALFQKFFFFFLRG